MTDDTPTVSQSDHRYNDDLLLEKATRQKAFSRLKPISFLLDFKQLRETFQSIDTLANSNKRKSIRWGLTAIGMGWAALTIAAMEPFYHGESEQLIRGLSIVSGLLGLAGVALGMSGVLTRNAKDIWLVQRLRTERLRQYFFQYFLIRINEVAEAILTRDTDGFIQQRIVEFEEYSSNHLELYTKSDVRSLTSREFDEHVWLIEKRREIGDDALDSLPDEFFVAYEELRFNEQIGYPEHKLDAALGLKSIESRFATLSLFVIFSIFLIHMFIAVAGIITLAENWVSIAHILAIVIALVGLAIRSMEEGLQPVRETERYERYAADVRWLRTRFRNAVDRRQKLEIMAEMERLSFAEMTSFLRVHEKSRYVL